MYPENPGRDPSNRRFYEHGVWYSSGATWTWKCVEKCDLIDNDDVNIYDNQQLRAQLLTVDTSYPYKLNYYYIN